MKMLKKSLILLVFAASLITADAQSLWQSSLPIKKPAKGVTVAGTVECDGRPVADVIVSDGYEITKTDKKGAYYLKSKKLNPQVFITTPSGYEAFRDDVVPQFWADFTKAPGEFERLDFRLNKVNQDKAAVIAITDVHLANQRNDVATFSGPYVDRLREETSKLNSEGRPVYTIHLGDGAWDAYWYAMDFPIQKFRDAFNAADFPTPLYNIMGNHDNDGATPCDDNTDLNAARPYMKAFGPRYYSFNVGGVHYVVLDNIEYLNQPADHPTMPGIVGRRNYNERFTPEQLDWLRKDLQYVSHDTPIIVAMHCPLLKYKGLTDKAVPRMDKESVEEFLAIVEPFDMVHSISGHSHRQVLTRLKGDKDRADHNIAGTSGAWWWTSAFGGKNLCPEGNPTGYEVFLSDGKDLRWRHETYEYEPGKQFWAWDMNAVKKFFAENGEYQVARKYYPNWSDFSQTADGEVWINIWAWDPEGTLKVTENGKELPVEMFLAENPMYNATYPMQRTVWLNNYAKSFEKLRKIRMFKVNPASPTSTIEISWTDPFGVETRESLTRPAPFTLSTLK